MKKVEQVVADMERTDGGPEDPGTTIHTAIETIIAKFRTELGLYGGRLYRRRGGTYVLEATFGQAKEVPLGLRVSKSYPPVELLLEQGAVYMDAADPRIDKSLEDLLGVGEFAAIELADEEYILAFNVAGGHHRDDVLFSLGILRHSINQKIRRERLPG